MALSTMSLVVAMSTATSLETAVAPLSLWLNGSDRGVHLVPLGPSGPCLSPALLQSIGVPEGVFPATAKQDECLHLDSPSPSIRNVLNTADGRLDLHVDPAHFERQTVRYRPPTARDPVPDPRYPRSSYLNYGIDLGHRSGESLEPTLPLEWVTRWDRWVLDTTLIARRGETRRASTTLQRDLPERLETIRIGDVSSGGTVNGGSAMLGLQWGRNFSYQPLIRRTPGLDFSGVLDTPSTVQIFVNERLVSTYSLPAGPFTLGELPGFSGSGGVVRAEIVDAFGQRRVIDQPYYLGASLLSPGQREFSYSIGLPRAADNGRYEPTPRAQISHRWAPRDQLTLGLEAILDPDEQILGARIDTGLAAFGEIGIGAYGEAAGAETATFGFASYRWSGRGGALNLELSERGAGFGTSEAAPASDQRRFRARLSRSLDSGHLAAFSYQRVEQQFSGAETYGLGISGALPANLRVNLQAQWDPNINEVRVLCLFSTSLRPTTLAQLSIEAGDDSNVVESRLSRSIKGYTGDAYRLGSEWNLADEDGAQWRGDVELERRAGRFIGRVSHREEATASATRMQFAGSMSLIDRQLAFGQPIRGSFVTVDAPDLRGAEVYADGRHIGHVGAAPLVVSSLSPYLAHRLRIRPSAEVAVGLELQEDEYGIALADRSGLSLRFEPRRLRVHEARIVRNDGTPAEYVPFGVHHAEGELTRSVTGENGFLYLEHLQPGSYRLRLEGLRPCEVSIDIVADDASTVVTDLGTLQCESRS